MRHQGSLAKVSVFAAIAALLLTSCTKTPTGGPASPANSTVELKRIEVPSRVLSIAGEVLAFAAKSEAGRAGEASVSLRRLQGRFGDFKRALVFEYNKDGKVLSQQEANVPPDGAIAFKATAGNRYLVYADLGSVFSNSYVVACGLSRARIPKQVVPRICTELFCTDNFIKVSTLKARIPELKDQPGLDELGDGVIGGFNRGGNICEECLHPSEPNGDFVPARGCSQTVRLDPEPSLPPDEIIFTRFFQIGEESKTQIFKLKSDGTEVNLSPFTKDQRNARPFYLSLHYTAPHWPWEAANDRPPHPELRGPVAFRKGGSLKTYASMMKSLDDGIGRVLRALAEAGLESDTLVIFTSDNGGERFSYHWPFVGQKNSLWEGGIRVPAIVRSPGPVSKVQRPRSNVKSEPGALATGHGRIIDQPIITMDWTATLLAAAQAKPDPNYPLDGIDLLPFIRGSASSAPRTFFWRNADQDAALKGKWKYLNDGSREYLFDLSIDQREQANFRDENPETFNQLKNEFKNWEATVLPRPTARSK